jgi:2-polyprenyl-3-methyl-5-hydroxy-6-metoxy-1,4-benzoquinol methylase
MPLTGNIYRWVSKQRQDSRRRAAERRRRTEHRKLVRMEAKELDALRREYRERFGDRLNMLIDRRDEIYLHHLKSSADVGSTPRKSQTSYFREVEGIWNDLKRAAADSGHPIAGEVRALDFACGYGGVTRFVVTEVPAADVTVSDIDRESVDFAMKTFGVDGFPSTADPAMLEHAGTYDLIVVVSLFTRLSPKRWDAWLARLYSMLRPGGAIIFSTHGMWLCDLIDEETRRKQTVSASPDFCYMSLNETLGRLDPGDYGTTMVSPDFVRSLIATKSLGRLRGYYPRGLVESHDLYVLERA